MYVGLKQPRGDGERYVTPARAAAKETNKLPEVFQFSIFQFSDFGRGFVNKLPYCNCHVSVK